MKIGICHYRVGKTDGVSLEIIKRKEVLEAMGHEVRLISGLDHNGADYSIDQLEYDHPDVRKMKNNAFQWLKDYASEEELMHDINKMAAQIERQFIDVHKAEGFDFLMLHNIFSHALHPAASRAFYDIAKKTGISIAAINHDFYWDPNNVHFEQPTGELTANFVEKYFLPNLPNIQHVVISKLNQDKLKQERGLDSDIIPDTFDFTQKPWIVDDYNNSLLTDIGVKENDLVVLQATRIVERKAIELAIDLVADLTTKLPQLVGKKLYNGKILNETSEIVFVLAGYAEGFALEYQEKLKNLISQKGIKAKFIHEKIDTWRTEKNGEKIYSLWDIYAHADLVTYPSIWEGWGNQLIEAVFAKKPIAVFEYPVFRSDIEPEGYEVISMGEDLDLDRPNRLITIPPLHLKAASRQAVEVLTNQSTNSVLEQNFAIGKKYHDNSVLEDMLSRLIERATVKAHV